MTDAILELDIAGLIEGFRSGAFTPEDALEATLEQADRVNPVINALPFIDYDGARTSAAAASARWHRGAPIGPLDGVPVTVKDSVRAVGMPWRHGTVPNARLAPSSDDAPPAARLREAGAVIFAKTAMPDFGMLASGVSSLYGIVRNPWDTTLSPGGSSSGAGASLAAGVGWASIGSDIAGSVRLPAAQCALAGFKPTQGRIPHLAPSTVRSAGPLARSVADLRATFEVVSAPDTRDLYSLEPSAADPCEGRDVAGLRVGVLAAMGYGIPADAQTIAALEGAAAALEDAGATIDSVPAPFTGNPYAALDRLFQVRARSEWESFPEELRGGVLPEVAAWCEPAREYSATDYERDLDAVRASAMYLAQALAPYDIVLAPVLPRPAFPAEAVGMIPETPLAHTSFTCWFNQTGQPAATVCFAFAEGAPIAVQIIGQRFEDRLVLDVTQWLEAHRPVAFQWPRTPRVPAFAGAHPNERENL